MPYYVIGDDKGFEEAYSADEVDSQIQTVNNLISSTNTLVTNVQNQVNGLNNSKQKAITSGTAAPSGGSNGDIYIQY